MGFLRRELSLQRLWLFRLLRQSQTWQHLWLLMVPGTPAPLPGRPRSLRCLKCEVRSLSRGWRFRRHCSVRWAICTFDKLMWPLWLRSRGPSRHSRTLRDVRMCWREWSGVSITFVLDEPVRSRNCHRTGFRLRSCWRCLRTRYKSRWETSLKCCSCGQRCHLPVLGMRPNVRLLARSIDWRSLPMRKDHRCCLHRWHARWRTALGIRHV
mmetsp:Transcript_53856/g.144180  ORF Transcript_53856/g.144180 Transcript_53856/m.144180 type:complete len:210 (+) Transcript_53856:1091-1720(+)